MTSFEITPKEVDGGSQGSIEIRPERDECLRLSMRGSSYGMITVVLDIEEQRLLLSAIMNERKTIERKE